MNFPPPQHPFISWYINENRVEGSFHFFGQHLPASWKVYHLH
jgi:hypothetical protein